MRTHDLLFRTLQLRPETPAVELAEAWCAERPDGLLALTAYEGAAQWVLRRLQTTASDASAPAGFVQSLRVRTRQEAARNLLVDAEAERVIARIEAAGIPCVLIKGTARRAAAARYPYADARATHDVDVLVPADAAGRAWGDLRAAGYGRVSEATSPHHLPPLIGEGSVGVELHTSLAHAMAPDEAWRRTTDGADELEWSGRRVRVPSATELLWHGLAHALKATMVAWRLRYFLDGSAILAAGQPIMWPVISERLDAGEAGDPAQARRWLGAAARLAGGALPAEVAGNEAAFDVARALRWRRAVLARHKDALFGARLLEEGTRVELGLSTAPAVEGTGPLLQARRRLGGRAARMVYVVWRALNAGGEHPVPSRLPDAPAGA